VADGRRRLGGLCDRRHTPTGSADLERVTPRP